MAKPLFLTVISDDLHYRGMAEDHRDRHEAYCEQWDYVYCLDTVSEAAENLPWFRIESIVRHLKDNENSHIFLMDSDAIVIDFTRDLRETLPCWSWLAMTIHPYAWERMDWHLQAGCFYVKQHPEALAFFEAVLSLRETPQASQWHDQAAINWLLLEGNPVRWQKGLRLLRHPWNNTGHCQPMDEVIVAAWHGAASPSQRREIMREFADAHPYPSAG